LATVTLLATSELIEKHRKLDALAETMRSGFRDAVSSLRGVSVQQHDEPEVGLNYLAERVRAARKSLDLASLSPAIPRRNPGANEWERAIDEVLAANKVRFRYVCAFHDRARLERVRRNVLDPRVKKFLCGFFSVEESRVPMPNFLVVDGDEVIVIFPFMYGEPESWISIRHPEVVKAFGAYFQRLFGESRKIVADEVDASFFDSQRTG